MKTHVTIAFCGNFRPLHVESETIAEAVKSALKRIACPEIKRDLKAIHRDMTSKKKAGLSITASGKENGSVSVRIADYPRDNWLDSITDSMPLNPLISY